MEARIGVLTRFEPGDDVTVVGVRIPQPPLCPLGEIGRRAGFRLQCLRTCEFDSRGGHAVTLGGPCSKVATDSCKVRVVGSIPMLSTFRPHSLWVKIPVSQTGVRSSSLRGAA